MKITDIFERKAIKQQRGATEQYRTSFKWRKDGGRMVSGKGSTQEEADEACLEKIRQRFRGTYMPLWLQFRGETILAWRDGDQWIYGHIREQTEPVSISMCGDWKSRDAAERAVRLHLAQGGWDEQEEESSIILHPADQEWFGGWVGKQKAFLAKFRRLLEVGWTRDEASFILGGGKADPARVEELGDPRSLLCSMKAKASQGRSEQ